eukprot:gene11970-59754_t
MAANAGRDRRRGSRMRKQEPAPDGTDDADQRQHGQQLDEGDAVAVPLRDAEHAPGHLGQRR